MIRFACPGCGRAFTVRDQDAGRKAKCKSCGVQVTVPSADMPEPAGAPEPADAQETASAPVLAGGPEPASVARPADAPADAAAPVAPKIPMRIRRLRADAQQMAAAFANFPLIRVMSTKGEPPEVYQVEYQVTGLERGKKKDPVRRERHLVEIQLTSEYPRQSPQCKMMTPVFHPNIDPSTICVGDHWTAGERLVDLVIRIGEMLAYQDYNIKSPLDAEAAMWADLNATQLPVDHRSLRPGEL